MSSQDARIRRSREFCCLWKIGFLLHQCLKPRVICQFREAILRVSRRGGSELGSEVLKILLVICTGFFEKLKRLGSSTQIQTFEGSLFSSLLMICPWIHGRAATLLDCKLCIQKTALTISRKSGRQLCRNVLEPWIISKLSRRLRFLQIGEIVSLMIFNRSQI